MPTTAMAPRTSSTGRSNLLFTSVHQYPGYPGTGTHSTANCHNFPVAPHQPRAAHLAALARSWEAVLTFKPDLVLVSAGFDAYAHDPITEMTLEADDFAELGRWLRQSSFAGRRHAGRRLQRRSATAD